MNVILLTETHLLKVKPHVNVSHNANVMTFGCGNHVRMLTDPGMDAAVQCPIKGHTKQNHVTLSQTDNVTEIELLCFIKSLHTFDWLLQHMKMSAVDQPVLSFS